MVVVVVDLVVQGLIVVGKTLKISVVVGAGVVVVGFFAVFFFAATGFGAALEEAISSSVSPPSEESPNRSSLSDMFFLSSFKFCSDLTSVSLCC